MGIAHNAEKVKAASAYSRGAHTAVAVGASGADKDGIIKLNSLVVGGLCVDRIGQKRVSDASRRRLGGVSAAIQP